MSWDSRSPSGALLVAPTTDDPAESQPEAALAEAPAVAAPLELVALRAEAASLRGESLALRAELGELRNLTDALVELLAEKGMLDADDLRARLANARRPLSSPTLPSESGHPYRGSGKPAEPPPPGTVACARCGTIVAERKVFLNADGRFCRDCFEPG
ncbi:MAG TPA: hypothetical protein PLR99_05200 [Polyangiaceae bacterium]|nr:hypothetical protein [Polyangiaceae bacterium]